jgi:hypothetical protein
LKQLIEAGVTDRPDEVLDNVVLGSDLFAPYRLGDQVMNTKADHAGSGVHTHYCPSSYEKPTEV